jgi:hypothetical protein
MAFSAKPKNKLRVFKNRVLRKISGPERDRVTGEWRRLHNEELNDPYSTPSINWTIKKRDMGAACGTYGRQEKCIRVFDRET